MSKIYDNERIFLLSDLKTAIEKSYRSDISVGYFSLKGWKKIAVHIDTYKGGEDQQCRLLIGMCNDYQKIEEENEEEDCQKIDNKKARKLKAEVLQNFKQQLTRGTPSNEDERSLKLLAKQIKEKKVVVKCFTRDNLHAKLYLTFNEKEFSKNIAFLGSSNLTYWGLKRLGELNIDVPDQEAFATLCTWFQEKWQDQFSLDISEDILLLIDESWVSEKLVSPYHLYIKMAYHLSEDARKGLSDYFIPKELDNILFDFQKAAVRIAAHYVHSKGGVLLGDVVGLGKTLMAVTVSKIFEEEHGYQTLILCPKNLEPMWNDYKNKYQIRGKVIPVSMATKELPKLKRYHLVIIDESHNLRNPQGKNYKIIKDYIALNDSKCILLSATPYNKNYEDLSSQLALFLDLDQDLGIKPEKFLKNTENFDGLPSSLKAFERSGYSEDWQQLMSQFLIRRTRSFIKENYTKEDSQGQYLQLSDGEKNYFPVRKAITVKYEVDEQYAKLFSEDVVKIINRLKLARYALHEYKKPNLNHLTNQEEQIFKDLKKGRSYPNGLCRINLFKRLESSGFAFLLSIKKYILRNCIFIYALENDESLIVGDKSTDIISSAFETDADRGFTNLDNSSEEEEEVSFANFHNYEDFLKEAKACYLKYEEKNSNSARWIPSSYFKDRLKSDLLEDVTTLLGLLKESAHWNPLKDLKLKKLEELIGNNKGKKLLIFSQSKDTANYVYSQLKERGINKLNIVTGDAKNIQNIVKSFSPNSNNVKNQEEIEITDVLITTDVLSEGQNLQDCSIVVNYDLPWAIIKLIQRVGRVDRIGQKESSISCHSFMPNDALEKLINLKGRIKKRLKENAEVIGTDESFFENDKRIFIDLYNENSNLLNKEIMEDIDLPSYALKIWEKAIVKNPELENKIKDMPNVINSSKEVSKEVEEGVLLFAKSYMANYLMQINKKGNPCSENQFSILKLAKCTPETISLVRDDEHYALIKTGLDKIKTDSAQGATAIGRLGNSRSPRRKIHQRIEEIIKKGIDRSESLSILQEHIYKYPLLNNAERVLKQKFRRKEKDQDIIRYAMEENNNGNLLNKKDIQKIDEKPQIVCSMGLKKT